MSDSDCTNCQHTDKCKHVDDTYDCLIRRARELQQLENATEIAAKLKEVGDSLGKWYYMNNEDVNHMLFEVDDLLGLFAIDLTADWIKKL